MATPPPYSYSLAPLSRSGWVATASDATFGAAANAIDGNTSTIWANNGTFPAWLNLDMLTPKTFDAVTVLPRQDSFQDYPGSIEIYVSTNGTTWGSPVYAQSGLPLNNTLKTFGPFPGGPVTFRWVRYNILSKATGARDFQGAAEVNVGTMVPNYIVAANVMVPAIAMGAGAKHQQLRASAATNAPAPAPAGGGNAGYTG